MSACNFSELKSKVHNWTIDDEEALLHKIRNFTEDYEAQCNILSKNLGNLSKNLEIAEIDFYNSMNSIKTISLHKFIEHVVDDEEPLKKEPDENDDTQILTAEEIEQKQKEKINNILNLSLSSLPQKDPRVKENGELDDETASVTSSKLISNQFITFKDLKLPFLIGTRDYTSSNYAGLVNENEFDDDNDKEAVTENKAVGEGEKEFIPAGAEEPSNPKVVVVSGTGKNIPVPPPMNLPIQKNPASTKPPVVTSDSTLPPEQKVPENPAGPETHEIQQPLPESVPAQQPAEAVKEPPVGSLEELLSRQAKKLQSQQQQSPQVENDDGRVSIRVSIDPNTFGQQSVRQSITSSKDDNPNPLRGTISMINKPSNFGPKLPTSVAFDEDDDDDDDYDDLFKKKTRTKTMSNPAGTFKFTGGHLSHESQDPPQMIKPASGLPGIPENKENPKADGKSSKLKGGLFSFDEDETVSLPKQKPKPEDTAFNKKVSNLLNFIEEEESIETDDYRVSNIGKKTEDMTEKLKKIINEKPKEEPKKESKPEPAPQKEPPKKEIKKPAFFDEDEEEVESAPKHRTKTLFEDPLGGTKVNKKKDIHIAEKKKVQKPNLFDISEKDKVSPPAKKKSSLFEEPEKPAPVENPKPVPADNPKPAKKKNFFDDSDEDTKPNPKTKKANLFDDEEPKDIAKDVSKDIKKDVAKEPPKDVPKDVPKDAPKPEPKKKKVNFFDDDDNEEEKPKKITPTKSPSPTTGDATKPIKAPEKPKEEPEKSLPVKEEPKKEEPKKTVHNLFESEKEEPKKETKKLPNIFETEDEEVPKKEPKKKNIFEPEKKEPKKDAKKTISNIFGSDEEEESKKEPKKKLPNIFEPKKEEPKKEAKKLPNIFETEEEEPKKEPKKSFGNIFGDEKKEPKKEEPKKEDTKKEEPIPAKKLNPFEKMLKEKEEKEKEAQKARQTFVPSSVKKLDMNKFADMQNMLMGRLSSGADGNPFVVDPERRTPTKIEPEPDNGIDDSKANTNEVTNAGSKIEAITEKTVVVQKKKPKKKAFGAANLFSDEKSEPPKQEPLQPKPKPKEQDQPQPQPQSQPQSQPQPQPKDIEPPKQKDSNSQPVQPTDNQPKKDDKPKPVNPSSLFEDEPKEEKPKIKITKPSDPLSTKPKKSGKKKKVVDPLSALLGGA